MLICCRQIGKTWLAGCVAVERTLGGPPNSSCAYLCPAATQARKIFWPRLSEYLAPMLPYIKIRQQELCVIFPGNRRIYLLGAEASDTNRGASYHTIIADERDNINDEFWRSVMLPTLNAYADTSFVLYLGTLGKGDSMLWKMYLENRDNPDWHCSVIPGDKAGVFSDEYLEELKLSLGDSAFRREIMCDPTAPVENAVVGELMADMEREGRITSFPLEPVYPTYTSWDLGIRDFTAVWGYQLRGRWIEVLFYREFSDIGADVVVGRIKDEFKSLSWGEAVLPHDAKNRGKEYGFSVEDIFHEHWTGGYHTYQAAPNPVSTIQATRVNLPRCRMEERHCELGITRLRSASYQVAAKTNTRTDQILHDDNSHCLDAFRYGMFRVEMLGGTQRADILAEANNEKNLIGDHCFE